MRKILEFSKLKKINDPQSQKIFVYFQFNYLLGIVMLFMMFMILSGISVYKLVEFGWFIFPAGLLITPFVYSLSNVITEVYGYEIARNMMWWFIFTSTIFTGFSSLIAHTPSPPNLHTENAYSIIFNYMPLIYIAGILGSIVGLSFNNYIVSKYKVKLAGKKYWLRSITSTIGGELVYNLIAYPIMWFNQVPMHEFYHIIISASLFKIGMSACIWPGECYLARFLKFKEGVNIIDNKVDYNIFRFKIQNINKPKLSVVK